MNHTQHPSQASHELMPTKRRLSVMSIGAWLVVICITTYGLLWGKSLFIPVSIAGMVCFFINILARSFEKIPGIKIRIPRWFTVPLATIVLLSMVWLCMVIIRSSVQELLGAAPAYQQTLQTMIQQIALNLGIEIEFSIASLASQLDIQALALGIGGGISSLAGSIMLISVYVIFLLFEQRHFGAKLKACFPEVEDYQRVEEILKRIGSTIRTYFTVKIFTSVLTGVCSYGVLWILGLDFTLFWAFLITVLNFIPSIGSIVATFLVALFALVQFGQWSSFFAALIGVGILQILIGNFLDPRLLGRSLNISPFVVLVSLTFWGTMWGVIGMFLSVPIMVSLIIVLSQFDITRPFAIMLTENGRLAYDPNDDPLIRMLRGG